MSLRAVVIANFVQACCWQVDRSPEPGETRRALGFHSEAGGKGLNVAIALQRLGVQVTPILAHGQDSAGEQLRALLHAEGLDLTHVHALPMASGWGAGRDSAASMWASKAPSSTTGPAPGSPTQRAATTPSSG